MAILNIITYDENQQIISYPLPDPQSIQWDSADIEAEGCSGTNQLGEYFRDVISQKTTLSVNWSVLSSEQVSDLMAKLAGESFILEYPDARSGQKVTTEMYVNGYSAPMYCYDSQTGTFRWQGLSISFMEV